MMSVESMEMSTIVEKVVSVCFFILLLHACHYSCQNGSVMQLNISPDEQQVACALSCGTVMVFEVSDPKILHCFQLSLVFSHHLHT